MVTLNAEPPDVSVVIPVYFNQENLPTTVATLLADVVGVNPQLGFELIFVDDGSGDGSLDVLLDLQRRHPGLLRVIKLTRNFGQVSASWCGYRHARGKYIVSMSADGQDPARLINEMLRAHEEGYDVVACAREERNESIYRTATSRVFYWLMRKLSFPDMPEGGFDFVSMSRRALNVFLANCESHPFFQGQVLWMGFTPKMIPYKREARQGGRSRWTFRKKLTYLIDGVLSYSYAPLRMMSLIGLVFACGGFLYAALIAALRITNVLPRLGLLAPLMVVVLVMGGMQMLMLGIIGEYIWRTLAQARNRPLYVIDHVYEEPREALAVKSGDLTTRQP
jgi:glycosyltransferase involved in cell wall biosynthesis